MGSINNAMVVKILKLIKINVAYWFFFKLKKKKTQMMDEHMQNRYFPPFMVKYSIPEWEARQIQILAFYSILF